MKKNIYKGNVINKYFVHYFSFYPHFFVLRDSLRNFVDTKHKPNEDNT